MEEHHLTVPRTARYHSLGDAASAKAIWCVLHGYGHLARYFLNTFKELDEGRLIVAPEGLSRFYLDEEHTRIGATWMTREDREHEMTDQISYLDKLGSLLLSRGMPGVPLNVLGFSQGVATACRWATHGHTRISRLVLWSGQMPPELDAALLGTRWATVRVDLVHGDDDDLVPASALAASEGKLRTANVHFNTHRFAGGHELERVLLERLLSE